MVCHQNDRGARVGAAVTATQEGRKTRRRKRGGDHVDKHARYSRPRADTDGRHHARGNGARQQRPFDLLDEATHLVGGNAERAGEHAQGRLGYAFFELGQQALLPGCGVLDHGDGLEPQLQRRGSPPHGGMRRVKS